MDEECLVTSESSYWADIVFQGGIFGQFKGLPQKSAPIKKRYAYFETAIVELGRCSEAEAMVDMHFADFIKHDELLTKWLRYIYVGGQRSVLSVQHRWFTNQAAAQHSQSIEAWFCTFQV